MHNVSVHGHNEVWKLVWKGATKPFCSLGDGDFYTCSCTGFAYGEAGKLFLVRSQGSSEIEEFELAPLFQEAGSSGVDVGNASLQRWEINGTDIDAINTPGKLERLASDIPLREVSEVMIFSDYDHDGANTEFLLQVGVEPCGKRMMALIGVSESEPKLHAFASVDHPERPLILPSYVWEELVGSREDASVIEWRCGDHGSETETELIIGAANGKIKVHSTQYSCETSGKRGSLIKQENL